MPMSLDNLNCDSLSAISSPPSPGSPTSPSHGLHRLDKKSSVRPYESKDAYLYAMKEDLAVWFNDLYNTALTADNLLHNLQDGSFLCLHANNVKAYIEASSHTAPTDIPNILFRTGAKPGSFQARDNLANFISWVRKHLGVNDVLLFESDDLVLMKNEKNVVLCLLEVARRGARYGMLAPMLVQFEQEIDELELKIKRAEGRRNSEGCMSNDAAMANSDTDSDKASLDEWVQRAVRRCTCPKQFPLINVSRGKYRIGHTQNTVFVRILRNHVMIRVGGGWDTLEHYLDKHDPCRCLKPSGNNDRRTERRRTSTGKETTTAKRTKSPSLNRMKSQSFTSLTISDQQTPKHSRSGSADILDHDIVMIRKDSGRHVIDERGTTPSPNPSKRYISPYKANYQKANKTRQGRLEVNARGDKFARSSSPSHDLVRKWKDTFRAQGSRPSIAESCDTHSLRNASSTKSLNRPRSNSRTRRSSSPARAPRSRSVTHSPARTLAPNRKWSAPLQASLRKDRRHSDSTQPTRIPAPVSRRGSTASNQMISSSSTCNSSLDSLMTI